MRKKKLTQDGTKVEFDDKTDWEKLALMKNEDIDFEDIPELDKLFFQKAVRPWPPVKKRLTIMKNLSKIIPYIAATFYMLYLLIKPFSIVVLFCLLSFSPPLFILGCLALLCSDNKPHR